MNNPNNNPNGEKKPFKVNIDDDIYNKTNEISKYKTLIKRFYMF